jgi:hypothetical protein
VLLADTRYTEELTREGLILLDSDGAVLAKEQIAAGGTQDIYAVRPP